MPVTGKKIRRNTKMSKINDEKLRELCVEGKLTNGQLAKEFGVTAEEIYAWRSRHGLTISKCQAIREGKVSTGKRSAEEIRTEIKKVEGVKSDAAKRVKRAQDRLTELAKELKESEG
jgi:bacterioferritin-associated ferredoxin